VVSSILVAIIVAITSWVFWVSRTANASESHLDSYHALLGEVHAMDDKMNTVQREVITMQAYQATILEDTAAIKKILLQKKDQK